LPKTSATFKEVVVGMPFTRETRAVDIGNLAWFLIDLFAGCKKGRELKTACERQAYSPKVLY
jgi:hypothetical protein